MIFQRMLPVRLMVDEVAVKADELARELSDLETAEGVVAERVKEMKEGLKEREAKIAKLAKIVRSKREERSVDCRRVPDLTRKVWMFYRDDTGEMVEQVPMTGSEYEKEAQLDFERVAQRLPPPGEGDEGEGEEPTAPGKPKPKGDGDGAPA